MAKITVRVNPPLEKLASAFAGFEDILLKHLREAIMGYGLLVERGSKMFSPVDTGRMRASIGTSMGIMRRDVKAIIQPNVDYAVYVHEGTRYMKGRPFMKWGLDAYKREGDRLVIQKIKEATEELARRAK